MKKITNQYKLITLKAIFIINEQRVINFLKKSSYYIVVKVMKYSKMHI